MANHEPHPTYFSPATELADLGRARFDHETAQITSRDHALLTPRPVAVRPGRAPQGLERAIHAWTVFQHTTEERDDREERKGDLHEGQLHRQNRAAREPEGGGDGGAGGRGEGKRGRGEGRNGREAAAAAALEAALCAGRKPEREAPPLAKGFAEELDKGMFWDGPIDG